MAVANEPTTMDPYGKNDSTSANFKVQVFDTLLALGPGRRSGSLHRRELGVH